MLDTVRPNVQFGANNKLSLRNLLEPVLGRHPSLYWADTSKGLVGVCLTQVSLYIDQSTQIYFMGHFLFLFMNK